MKNNVLNVIKFLVGWPLSIVALVFLWKFFTPHITNIEKSIIHANFLFLFLSFLAFSLYFLFRILLWQEILKEKGHKVPLKHTAWYWTIAEVNRYIPGNVWSIIGRGATFGKLGIKQSTLLAGWVQESIVIVVGSLLMGSLSLGFVLAHILHPFPLKNVTHILAYAFIFLLSVLWIFQQKLRNRFVVKFPATFHQLLLAVIAFVFFGLGTYLSIVSLFPLPLEKITLFISLFSLSFAIGYLSFITPMGLGVREFVVSESLIPFLASSVVGFASLFTRLFLIVSELLFLCGAAIVFSFSLPFAPFAHVKKHFYIYTLWVGIVGYIAYFTSASFLRYTNFFTGRFDLGNMDQTVWNTLHGKIFMLTDPNGTNVISRLGTHADFILVLLAPFYIFWEDPRTLLFIQSAVLGMGALFVFLLTKDILKNKTLALILSFAYLLNPSIQYTNLYDFHAVAFATTFFLAAWYFITKRKYFWTLLFLLLAGITKEEAWIVVGFFGVYMFFWEKKKLLGSILTACSFGAFYVLIWKLIPFSRGGQHFALAYYADYGNTPTNIIKTMLLSPIKILGVVFGPSRLIYYIQLLLPVSFLALIAPQMLLFAFPDLAINALSNNTAFHQIYYQYTAVITPFLFIATIYAIARLQKMLPNVSLGWYSFTLLLCALISAYLYGPFIGALHPNIAMFVDQERNRDIIQSFLNDIPPSFSVAATNNIGSHLSHRQNIYTIPVGIDKADIVVFLLNDAFAQPSLAAQRSMAEAMKHDKNYIEIFRENDFVVFEKRNLYTRDEPTIEKGKLYPAAIEALQHRDFEGGTVNVQKVIKRTPTVTTVLFSYPSDGLILYGRADIPVSSQSTFPVVIIDRGYISSADFQEETSYENIAQTFAQHGFLAITPNFRNNGQSDKDTSIAGILGYPIDELNLIDSLKTFPQADTKHVFLWGFSVGGQVTLTTLETISQNKNIIPTVQAASVWNAITDPYTAYTRFTQVFPGQPVPYQRVANAFGSYARNPIPWQSVSPFFYLNEINTPLRIVDAFSDPITPYQWSIELYDTMRSYHENATLSLYTTDHNFTNSWRDAVITDIQYFQSFLK